MNQKATFKFFINSAIFFIIVSFFAVLVQQFLWYAYNIDTNPAKLDYHFADSPYGRLFRSTGLTLHPNYLGTISVDYSCFFLLLLSFKGEFSKKQRILYFMAFLLIFFQMLASISRGSWVAFALCFPVILLFRFEKLKFYIIIFIICFLAIFFISGAAEKTYELLVSLNETSFETRTRFFGDCFKLIAKHPITGYGLEHFQDYPGPALEKLIHNTPLQIATEIGIFGVIIYSFIFIYIFYKLYYTFHDINDNFFKCFIGGIFIMLCSNFIYSLSEPNFLNRDFYVYIAVAEAAMLSTFSNKEKLKIV
jgi:O-antigen ligase